MAAKNPTTSARLDQSGIYQIRHIASGKVYVGSAVQFRKRWNRHRYELNNGIHYNPRLQRAWNKYGPDAFVFEILEIVESQDDLLAAEQAHLDRIRPYEPRRGYNICPDAEAPMLGRTASAETRAKLSAVHSGPMSARKAAAIQCPERRRKISESLKGRPCSPETRAKLAESMRRRMADPEYRERTLKAAHAAAHAAGRTEEGRRQRSEAGKRQKLSEEHKAVLPALQWVEIR
jgi:group I intron endonuclease